MFISRALEKIAADKLSRKSPYLELREACREGVEYLKMRVDLSRNGDTSDSYMPQSLSQENALLNSEKLLIPLELACKSKSSKIVAISLDCLQKLVAYGHVSNGAVDSGNMRIIERIVQTICSCFNVSCNFLSLIAFRWQNFSYIHI